MIDYKSLLKKYIDHVTAEEGTSFIGCADQNPEFSDEELEALIDLRPIVQTSELPLVRSSEFYEKLRGILVSDLQTFPHSYNAI